ncbi:DNA polymerase III subunit beta [Campylobacter sp. FMV-PI01]|uniref:Beta sliding clamp n=1 Tax=Campylobacter portucalensis TaxID=2608384 RepID=A0A6L5WKH7_9BACT|nr:DNA polymerase III subunit beta [Campylobacter portucalensis]MSN96251.1 DNA polymerase III subunit beta [Campylobacter portucalensis]
MKFIIDKNLLNNVINSVNSYIDKKDISSITSHIFIEAKDDIINIKATDHEMGLAYKIKTQNIQIQGNATANGKTILDVIKGLKDDDIIIETMNNFLYIKQKTAKFKLPMYNSTDFPDFPSIENKKSFDINFQILSRSLKKVLPTIDISNPNHALNACLIEIKPQQINFVGTDGKRLGLYILNKQTNNTQSSILMPKRAINEIQKIFFEEAEIYYDENIFIARNENFEFYTKLINKKFPNYQKVIPSEFETTIEIQRDKILEGIKTINMICYKMQITIKPNLILFESISEDNSEAKTEILVDTQMNKDEIILKVTNKFLIDFLNSIENNIFKLNYNNKDVAFMLSSDELINIIMPTI